MSKNIISNNENAEFCYITNINNPALNKSFNRSFDEIKHNIKRSIDESKNQIPHFNTIVNNYQEQLLQTAKEISENYIESQQSVINSVHSAWRPYNERFTELVNNFASSDSMVKVYSRCVGNFADNVASAMRMANNMIVSNLDVWKSVLHQSRDNSKHIFNQNVNAAKTFEQNSRDLNSAAAAAVKVDINANDNLGTTNTTSSFTQSNRKI
ncbi:MAG TPA: hypothetical protein VIY08_16435 [Candidatus Nitrosocosmicus sp.]